MKKRKRRPSGRNCGQRWLPLAWIELRYRHCRAACGRHTHQRTEGRRCKDDDAVAAPRAATFRGRVSQCLRCSACQIDALQFAPGKKTDRIAIGCPERMARFFGARERLRRDPVERPHPNPRNTLRGRNKRQLPTVRRERKRAGIASWRRNDVKARDHRLGHRAADIQQRRQSNYRNDNGERSNQPRHALAVSSSGRDRACDAYPESPLRRSISTPASHRSALCHRSSGSFARQRWTT